MFEFEEAAKMKPEILEGKSQEQIDELRKVAEPFSAFMGALFEANNKKKMEESKVQTVKNITVELGEDCKIDVELLHKTLTKLPAEMYLDLYRKMYTNIYGYPPIVNLGGCGAPIMEEEKTE